MLRQVIQCKQKNGRWPTWDPPTAKSTNGTARCSLTLEKQKIVFKIRKDYLGIILFQRVNTKWYYTIFVRIHIKQY